MLWEHTGQGDSRRAATSSAERWRKSLYEPMWQWACSVAGDARHAAQTVCLWRKQ